MQSYLQPDVLEGAGVDVFDSWAANFARTHTALELAPDGASYQMKTRFARFDNVPELLGLYHQVADVRTAEDLALAVPEVKGGQAEAVAVPASDQLRRFVQELAQRADEVSRGRVLPTQDNMLKITGEGRQAALDMRLVGRAPDPTGGKVTEAARRIAAIYQATREATYRDNGEPSPRPGALQLVFCDVSTPAGEGWNAYDGLRHQLVRRGVPDDAIRYMQDAKSHEAKGELFAACRDGRVAVLIGSTETMGVGTNVQARAVALHHLDAPWRPADLEQREGRIIRQGNQNPTVEVVRYVTEGSFDTYMWQTLERKARFISQVTSGKVEAREVEEIDEQVLSYAEVKALATGDPRIMEKAGVDSDVGRLSRLEMAHQEEQQRLRTVVDKARRQAADATERADRLAAVAEHITDTSGKRFEMTVDGAVYRKRGEAGEALWALAVARLRDTPLETTFEHPGVATLAGLDVRVLTTTVIEDEIQVLVPEAEVATERFFASEWENADCGLLVQRLERRIHRLPTIVEDLRRQAAGALAEAERAEALIGQPWEHADELAHLRRRQQELDEALTEDTSSQDVPPQDRASPSDQQPNAASTPIEVVEAGPADPSAISEDEVLRRLYPGDHGPGSSPAGPAGGSAGGIGM